MSHVLARLMEMEVRSPVVTLVPRPMRHKPKPNGTPYSVAQKEALRLRNIEIAKLVSDGVRYADIAAQFGISKAGVCRALKRMTV